VPGRGEIISRHNSADPHAPTQGEIDMKFKSRALGALAGVLAFVAISGPAAAADRPYSEGPVVWVSAVRTMPGMFDDYMAWLAGPYKQAMEAQKAAGVILGYSVYSAVPRGPDDPDLYLTTTYKNMAALDDMNAKLDPIYEKLQGSLAEQNKAFIDRGKMRTIVGDELVRELKLK
jgi:hypothetical protein